MPVGGCGSYEADIAAASQPAAGGAWGNAPESSDSLAALSMQTSNFHAQRSPGTAPPPAAPWSAAAPQRQYQSSGSQHAAWPQHQQQQHVPFAHPNSGLAPHAAWGAPAVAVGCGQDDAFAQLSQQSAAWEQVRRQ